MVALLLSSIQPIRAQPVTDADVERAITEGTEALLMELRDDWLIRTRDKNDRAVTLQGEVLSRSSQRIRFRKRDGTKLAIPRNRIDSMIPKGAYSREVQGIHKGGHTALVTFALLSAGVPPSHPKIESALEYLQEAELPGTYSRALRAGIWSLLAQHEGQRVANHKYRHLLRTDSRWLIRAMDSKGWYTYHDRDNDLYIAWDKIARDPEKLAAYLDEFVHGVPDRAGYMEKNAGLAERLKADQRVCAGVNYGF